MADTYINEIRSSTNSIEEAKKIFLSYQSHFFLNNQPLKYAIQKEIADRFNVSISNIRVCGSAHIGESPHKGSPFKVRESDLDIAIISAELFSSYIKISKSFSREFNDISAFPKDRITGKSLRDSFCYYAAMGYFRPDLMPNSTHRAAWMNFFGKLSDKYSDTFKNINAGLYVSEDLYLDKQFKAIEVIKSKGVKAI